MKTIEEVQRFKQDKCTLLLQTAECCDISEIIEQLKGRNLPKFNNRVAPATNADTARNLLIKKFNQNYVTIDSLKNGVKATNGAETIEACPKSMGSGYKVLPKYIQNIESIGFEKPNWKPLLLNDKIETQLNTMSVTNSLQSFRGGKVTYRSSKTSLNTQREYNKLDMLLNSDTHRQKSLEMNRKKSEKRENYASSHLSSSSTNDFNSDQAQSDAKPLLQHKKLLLGPSKLKLNTVKVIPRRMSSTTLESSVENFNDLSPENITPGNEKFINLPPLKQASERTYATITLADAYSLDGTSSLVNAINNKTNNNSKLSFYTDNEAKIRESNNLADAISISKISPLSKQRHTSIATESDTAEAVVVSVENGGNTSSRDNPLKTTESEQPTDSFFSNILKQKSDLDAYLNVIREKTSLTNAPPNTPTPFEISKATVNIKPPSTPQEEIRLMRVPDSRKFPPANSTGIPISTNLQQRRRKQFIRENSLLQQTIKESRQETTNIRQPLIKTSTNMNVSNARLTTNLEHKIGQNSVNMIKINNKNVNKILSNMSPQNTAHSHTDSTHSFASSNKKLPIVPSSINDKLRIDIYIPNLS